MFERLDADARVVFEIAQREARALDHNYIGTEHVLLALARGGGAMAELLIARGCGAEQIRAEIVAMIGRGRPQREPDALLATLGIDLDEVRRHVESTFGADAMTRAAVRARPRRRTPWRRWWPGCDRGQPFASALVGGRWFGLAPRLKKVVEMATTHAAPEPARSSHVLLAILEEGNGVACRILATRHVDLVALKKAIAIHLGLDLSVVCRYRVSRGRFCCDG
jgi:ATP-dependent Clp protease ATP-binding subunit ClpA